MGTELHILYTAYSPPSQPLPQSVIVSSFLPNKPPTQPQNTVQQLLLSHSSCLLCIPYHGSLTTDQIWDLLQISKKTFTAGCSEWWCSRCIPNTSSVPKYAKRPNYISFTWRSDGVCIPGDTQNQLTQSWATNSRCPCLRKGLDRVTSRCPFQSQSFLSFWRSILCKIGIWYIFRVGIFGTKVV